MNAKNPGGRGSTLREEVKPTQRAGAAELALFVALDPEAYAVCAEALGDAVAVVRADDAAAARELIAALRPRLVVAASSLNPVERSEIAWVAAAYDSRVVSVQSGMSLGSIERLLQGALIVAFDR